MRFSSIVAAGVLAVASFSAAADQTDSSFATFVPGGNTWTWTFTLLESGTLDATVFEAANTVISDVSLKDSSNTLVGGSSWSSTVFSSSPAASLWDLSDISVAAGTYSIVVTGKRRGDVFAEYALTAAPVPEPETYAMMLAGLGAIGFMARRRQAK